MRRRPILVPAVLCAAMAVLAAAGCETDDPAPSGFEIVSIEPADGSVSVSLQQAVRVTFNADVHPDSILGTNNIIVVDSKNQIVRGSFSVSGAEATFSAAGGWTADTTYGVAVRRTVFDLEGAPVRYPRAARFSTGTAVETIAGFPPFDEYPLPPDASRITAEIRGSLTEVRGSADAVERPAGLTVHVNVRNQTAGGAWVVVLASSAGSFAADLPAAQEGDLVEINAGYAETLKVGPSVTVTALYPFGWTALAPAGVPPAARQGHGAVLDPAGNRMVVFGGSTSAAIFGGARNDTFALSLAPGSEAWAALAPPAPLPSARFGHSAVYDPDRHRMIVFGGDNGLFGVTNDVWALDLTAGSESWTALAPLGTPPAARAFHAAVFDPAGPRMLVFGGRSAQFITATAYDDLWELSLPASGSPAWTQLAPSGLAPLARYGAFGILDGTSNRLLVGFGTNGALYLPETHGLDLAALAWAPLLSTPGTSGPAAAAAALDTLQQRVLVFGGQDSSGPLAGLLALDLAAGTWSTLGPEGTAPAARSRATLVFDPVGGRSLLFGGTDGTAVLGDLHQLR